MCCVGKPGAPYLFHRLQATLPHRDTSGHLLLDLGRRTRGGGVDKSLPAKREYSRKSTVTSTQTVCEPTSSLQVLQQPSRKNPVAGDVLQGASSPPSTFIASSFVISLKVALFRSSCSTPLKAVYPAQGCLSRSRLFHNRLCFHCFDSRLVPEDWLLWPRTNVYFYSVVGFDHFTFTASVSDDNGCPV